MKQYWQKLAAKIDALTLRERVIIFAMLAVAVIALINNALLDAQFARQKQLSEQIKGQQLQIGQIQADIKQTIQAQADPDAANRLRLGALQQQSQRMQADLIDLQKGLVAPDRMPVLLEDILKHNARLKVISLKTMPVTGLQEKEGGESKDSKKPEQKPTALSASKSSIDTVPAANAVYKHGVEITLQGEYLDMLKYMSQLESMPWRLFWGKAELDVDEYPKATLTLTLYTLSLDKKWLNL